MTLIEATFRLDSGTMRRLARTSALTGKSHSEIVRVAVQEYEDRLDPPGEKLSEEEHLDRLRRFDELLAKIPSRPQSEIDAEKADIREARRLWAARDPEP